MTSSTEVNSVLTLIKKYNLTQYDNVCTETTDNPYPVPTRTLKRTCTGDDVKWLQYELNKRGLNIGSIDGIFGNKSLQALKQFQKKAGITIDGLCGKDTRAMLKKILKEGR